MQKNLKTRISLFSGGTGNDRFVNLIKNIPGVEIDIIVNGYDDGKSTGEIRKLIPGMLGPSDFRKNLSHLINLNATNGKIFQNILNFRFPNETNYNDFISFLKLEKSNKIVKKLNLYNLTFEKFLTLKKYLLLFLKYYYKKKKLKLSDISLGNILISSAFLKNKKNFNKSLTEIHSFLEIKNNVYNVSTGENLYLVAILENGSIILDEEQLVNFRHKHRVENIFLLKKKLTKKKLNLLNKKNKKFKINYLNKANKYPNLNPIVKEKLLKSDIIIYGPGTQYSSLFPSYLTKNLRETISKSKAKKFLITNIFLDNDIVREDVESLINKFNIFFNKNQKKTIKNSKLIDYYLINKFDEDDKNLLKKNNYLVFDKKKTKNFTLLDWEKGEGLHYPNWLAKTIFNLANKGSIKKFLPKSVVSIVIPCLNEKRTIYKVLNRIKNLKIQNFNLVIEVIVVDGGSNDGSIKVIKKFKDFKFYSLNNVGKGEATRYGIDKSKGDVIIFFPSDNEYNVQDIEKVITPLMLDQSKAVFGSRMIKNILEDQLSKIYKNNFLTLFLSKYGGKLINLFILALYNKAISDPFTSIKGFDAQLLKSLTLSRNGFDLDFEIFVKLFKKKCFFLEVPVDFKPRTPKQGKKITTIDGIKCLVYIIFSKFF
tara:strand:- start:66 stop:2021 length:1956 start_codon:yes stop_codon:yes gene_type:complete